MRNLDLLANQFARKNLRDAIQHLMPAINWLVALRNQVAVEVDEGACSLLPQPRPPYLLVADVAQERRLADMRLADHRGAFTVGHACEDGAERIFAPDEVLGRDGLAVV